MALVLAELGGDLRAGQESMRGLGKLTGSGNSWWNCWPGLGQRGGVSGCHRDVSYRYRAMYQYRPQNEDELELREGDRVDVMQQCDDGWFVGMWGWGMG